MAILKNSKVPQFRIYSSYLYYRYSVAVSEASSPIVGAHVGQVEETVAI